MPRVRHRASAEGQGRPVSLMQEPPRVSAGRRVRLGSLHVDGLTFAQALDAIASMVEKREGGVVFTPNVDHVVMADEDERFREAYGTADLSLADGMPVLWASRLLGEPLPEKVSGSDLVLPLMERADRGGWRIYVLGGAPGVAARAAERIVERFPRVRIAGTSSPLIDMKQPPSARDDLVECIRATTPDLVLVALGAPKQELFIAEAASALRPAVLLGVGAAVDFIAGTARRAPPWVSAAGFEWLYRLVREPRRLWRRYLLRDPKFLFILLREIRSKLTDRSGA